MFETAVGPPPPSRGEPNFDSPQPVPPLAVLDQVARGPGLCLGSIASQALRVRESQEPPACLSMEHKRGRVRPGLLARKTLLWYLPYLHTETEHSHPFSSSLPEKGCFPDQKKNRKKGVGETDTGESGLFKKK